MTETAQDRRERQKEEQRRDLIRAAHDLVREEGYDGLTIRKLATRAGFATMSVYSYFPDKHAILVALAEDHFQTLADHLNRDYPGTPLDALRDGLLDYVAFGMENPNEYRSVFMHEEVLKDSSEFETIATSNPAMVCLLKRVQAVIDDASLKGDAFAIGTLLWTVAHGAVSLFITAPHYPFGDRQAYARQLIDVALKGLAAAPARSLTTPA